MSSVMNGLQGLDDLQVAAAAEHASRVLQAFIFHSRDTGRGVARHESKTRSLPVISRKNADGDGHAALRKITYLHGQTCGYGAMRRHLRAGRRPLQAWFRRSGVKPAF